MRNQFLLFAFAAALLLKSNWPSGEQFGLVRKLLGMNRGKLAQIWPRLPEEQACIVA
jgi:hypothetical protein